jgi:hypothetical protein
MFQLVRKSPGRSGGRALATRITSMSSGMPAAAWRLWRRRGWRRACLAAAAWLAAALPAAALASPWW